MQAKSKPPFDQLVASLSPTIIKKPVCLLQVGGTSTLDDAAKKLVAVVAGQPDWTPSRFGSCLGLSDARIGELAACESDGDGKANQMEGIILAWAENLGEGATVEAVLKSLYDEDESEILEKFTELTVSGDSKDRDATLLARVSSPETKVQETNFNAKSERKLSAVVPPNLDSPPHYGGQVELVSDPTPTLPAGSQPPFPSAIDETRDDTQTPIEESQQNNSGPTSAQVTTTFTTPPKLSSEQEGGPHRMVRMLSDLENLSKSMRVMEKEIEAVQADHERECLMFKQKSEEWDSELLTLRMDNQQLCTTVKDLQDELDTTKQKLHEALEEIDALKSKAATLEKEKAKLETKLQKEKAESSLDRERVKRENVELERENAELQKEVIKLKSLWQTYEKEISEMKEKMKNATRELEQLKEKKMSNDQGNTQQPQQSEGSGDGKWVWNKSLKLGKFGNLFSAHKIGESATHVVKVVTVAECDLQGQSAEVKNAVEQEMKTLQGYDHPRIMKYIDHVAKDSLLGTFHFYIIMEYMRQGSVYDLLEREGKLEERKAAKYTRQLLEGLQYLHDTCSVIHCRVKCSNILLDENGSMKLAGYGRFECLSDEKGDAGGKASTAWWKAPEIIEGSTPSEKSDIWSVGTSINEMLTGERPFSKEEQDMAVIYGAQQRSKSLDTLICGPGFSHNVQEFLKLCINWEPSQRSTASQLLKSSFLPPD